MTAAKSPKSGKAGHERPKPYTSALHNILKRRKAAVDPGKLRNGSMLWMDARQMGQSSVFYAEVTQEKLASQLGCGTSAISNLNYPDRGPNEDLVESIEKQLLAWGLIDSHAELNLLRAANGVRRLSATEERALLCEIDPDACDPDQPETEFQTRRFHPSTYVRRPEHAELLDRLRTQPPGYSVITGVVTAVQGTGGGGKTTLAEAVVDDLAADRRRFKGRVRLVFSQKHDPAARISEAIGQLTGARYGPPISNLEEGTRLLKDAAHGQWAVLLDDVWDPDHLGPFLYAFQHCPIVITTRFTKVLRETEAVPFVLGKYTDAQALEQISSGLPEGQEAKLQALARRLTNWPLALALANAFIHDLLASDETPMLLDGAIAHANREFDRYGLIAYDEKGSDDPTKSTDASIRLNLTRLKPDEVIAFEKLVVFQEDARVPRDVLLRWHQASAGWDDIKARKLCEHLKQLWLTQGYEGLTNPVVHLHDHIWMYLQGKHKNSLVAWQKEFLDAVRPKAIPEDTGEPWPSSPWARLEPANNGYLWRNLEHHLTEAGLQTEWREAVCDWHFIASRATALGEDLSDIAGWDADLFVQARAAENSDEFVLKLIGEKSDSLGAAHCAGLPGVRHRVQDRTRELLRGLLVDLVRTDPDRRRRDHAIRALFEIGHPDFKVKTAAGGLCYIEPARTPIVADRYPLGDDNPPYTNDFRVQEMPREMYSLPAFELGTYAVTNAEMACFVRAGGYEDERWWVGDRARAWRRGIGTADYRRRGARMAAEYQKRVGKEQLERDGFSQRQIERGEKMSVDDLTNYLADAIDERYGWPGSLNDTRFGHPAQPATWICFYEAVAYCRWLSHVSYKQFELPTEDEWEAACTGPNGNIFAFPGQFDAAKCNTQEADNRRTTPVGAFPSGATPRGAHDLTGNVWEWTASGFGVDPYTNDGWLPARNVRPDERNEVGKDWQCRVVRGGSWSSYQIGARAAFRFRSVPSDRSFSLGFRVVLRP